MSDKKQSDVRVSPSEDARTDSSDTAESADSHFLSSNAADEQLSTLSRRRLLQIGAVATGSGVAASVVPWTTQRAAAAGAASSAGGRAGPSLLSAVAASTGPVVEVPAPTGVASVDTANALAALNVPAGTTVYFQVAAGQVYSINQELPVPPGVRVSGYGAVEEQPHTGLMPTLQQAPGTALKCIMASAGYLAGLYNTAQYNNGSPQTTADSGIEVDHLAFDGSNGGNVPGNTMGHGLVLYSVGSSVHDCYFKDIAECGVVVSDANYAGTPCVTNLGGNRLYDCKTTNSGGHGIWVTATTGSGGCTDGYLMANVLESPSQQALQGLGPRINPVTNIPYEALHMDNAAGWWVENNHGYACPGGGMYFAAPWGAHIAENSTDSFGVLPEPGKAYIGYSIVTALAPGAAIRRPTLFVENKLQAYEGINTNGPLSPNASNKYTYYQVTMNEPSLDNMAWVGHASNSAHPNSPPSAPISGAVLQAGSAVASVPHGTTSGVVQAGMSISDSAGAVPGGSTVVGVTPGSGTSPDQITMSAKATSSASGDTLSFPGPASIGWTYLNNLAGSTLVVHRTNEIIADGISATAVVAGVGNVTIVDPANLVGGVNLTGVPTANQVIVATSAQTAVWADPVGGGVHDGPYDVRHVFGPGWGDVLRFTCVGGGGGGGGGGSAASGKQAGGAGAAAGSSSEQIVSVGSNSSLTVTVGGGGVGGSGGASGASGGSGSQGGDSAATGTGVSVLGTGGPGGLGSKPGASTVYGAAYGGQTVLSCTPPPPVAAARPAVRVGHPPGSRREAAGEAESPAPLQAAAVVAWGLPR